MTPRFLPTLFACSVCLSAWSQAAPLINSAIQFPAVPSPGETVKVTADITGASQATLNWRLDGGAAFQAVSMTATGNTWTAGIPPQANGTVVEFSVTASGGGTTTWPSPTQTALLRVEESAVNSSWAAGAAPVWRLLTRASDSATLAAGTSVQSSVVIRDGGGLAVRHACSLRQREASPKAWSLTFPSGAPWQGRSSVNLSADRPHCQVFGAAVFSRAGLPTAAVETIEVRMNGVNAAASGSPSFGRIALSEPFDAAWAARQFPASAGGNLYRMDDSGPGTHGELAYETPATAANYAETYLKTSGAAPHDLADIIALTDKLSNAPQSTYRADISQRLDLEQWLRFLALDSLLGNGEPGLQTGQGTDVVLYHLPSSDRILLVPHELRAILGRGASAGTETRSLFSSDATAGLNRMMTHPDVLADYTRTVQELLDSVFASAVLDPLLQQLMGGWVPGSEITAVQQFITARRASAAAQLPSAPPALSITGEAAAVENMATTATGTITLSGTFPVAQTGSVTVNGQPAILNFRTIGGSTAGTWTFTATGAGGTLVRGVNQFLVEFWSGTGGTGTVLHSLTGEALYSGGGTTVPTTIAASTHWTVAGSPWRVTANVTVSSAATLTIDPGVSVFVSPARKITINGVINVAGTAYGRVRFSHVPGATPVDNPNLPGTQIGPPKWGGVVIDKRLNPLNIIAYADFHNAEKDYATGCITVSESAILVDHCTFWGTKFHAIRGDSNTITVQDCYFPSGYLPGENPLTLGLDNNSEFIQMNASGGGGTGFTGAWPTGGVLRFYRNTFGALPGHNDLLDIVAGKWGSTPVLDVQDNYFLGPVGDEAIDMEGDAYVAGNFFSNVKKDQYTEDLGYANALSMNESPGVSDVTSVLTRNVFTRVDHAVMMKGPTATYFEHNTFACQNNDYAFTGGSSAQTVKTSVAGFYIPEDDKVPGEGAYFGYNLLYGGNSHQGGAANAFSRVFGFADSKGTTTKIEMFANFIDPAIQDPVIGIRHPNNVLHPSWQGVTGNPLFTNVAADDYSLAPGSPARGTAPHGFDYGASIPKGCYLVNLPPIVSSQNSASITVGGPGIFSYKWRLDAGAWSAPVTIAPGTFSRTTPTVRTATLALTSLSAGLHTLEVIGRDFAGNWTPELEATRSSWTVDTVVPLLSLNEIQAGAGGGIEIFNGGISSIALSGWSLTDTAAVPGKFSLTGTLAAGAYLTLPSAVTGITLPATGGMALLFQGVTQRDAIAFGPQSTARSLGRIGRERLWTPCTPTASAANTAAATGLVSTLRFSEWLAASPGWVEITSTDALPVVLDGLTLTSNLPGGAGDYTFPAHSLIAPGGFLTLHSPATLPFSLSGPGTVLTLLDGDTVLDSIQLSRAVPGSSEGRNVSGQTAFFPTPTPDAANGPGAPATLSAWLGAYGATAGTDQDGDASTAVAEYALGTLPLDAKSVARLSLSSRAPDGSQNLSFVMPAAGRADIDYTVESATSLAGPWTAQTVKQGNAAWTGSAPVTTGAEEGGYAPVSVRLQPGSAPRTFHRLRFTLR